MSQHDLRIERLHNPGVMRYDIRVSLEIAGRPYRFQVSEPRLGEHFDPRSVHPRVLVEVGGDIIDTKEKQFWFVYWSIYFQLASMIHGSVLDHTMENIGRIFRREGNNWDNTRSLEPARRQGVTAPPLSTTLTRADIERACNVLQTERIDIPHYWTQYTDAIMGMPISSPKPDVSKKAWQLLKQTIGDKRFRDLELKGYFEVQGKRGVYRFHKNKQGGVTFVEMRQYGERIVPVEFDLCIQSQAVDLPDGDAILSRYLTWQEDEERFLQIANFRRAVIVDEANVRR